MLRNLLVPCLVLVGLNGAQSANTTDCGSNPADIVFLLDSSGSVGSSNFQKQKDFVARFAQSFDIGPNNVQIGVETFATSPRHEFNMNSHRTKADLVKAINAIGYHSGGTRTDLALKFVEGRSFKAATGDRPGVSNILIVMTDGKSNQPQLTVAETAKLHRMNLKVFAIGIGSGVDKGELGHIASDAQHVFQVQNFDALNTLQAELKKTACTVDGGWSKWGSYAPCTKSCGGGTKVRTRTCTSPRPANGGKQCTGSAKDSQACNTGACPTTPKPTPAPVNGGWSKWGAYSPCTKSCGGGTHSRTRTCTNPRPAHGGKQCTGSATDSKACNAAACPTTPKPTPATVNGGWTKWGSYSPCTKSCGGGTHSRTRTCTNPRPANGGKQCTGSATDSQPCNAGPCPTTPKPTTASGCNGTEPADVVFILDASGSVGSTNFQKMLNFVNKLVDGFPVSPKATQIGVITFDSKVYLQFHLNKFHTKNDIKNAVSHIRYTSGTTHTSDALKYARETAFKTQNGMRPNAAKIAIVITDGQSNSQSATTSEAGKLRGAGVTVFSIGVGSGAKMAELNAMATDPDSSHVFTVTNFNSLNTIKGTLAQKTCEVKATTLPPPTTPKPKSQCNAQADIVFLLDSSGSVGSTNFQKMLGFVKNVANNFDIGPKDVQIGVDTFQTSHKAEFNLNSYSDKQRMLTAINNIKYTQGLTHTGEAIRFMRTDSFSAAKGDRPNVPNVAIIVTDGQSGNPPLTASEAKKARDAGITILAIGVGSGARTSELNAMATDPDSTHVYKADNFDALTSLQALLSTKACEVSKPVANNTAPTCASKADMLFILDSSGSIGQTNYDKMLTFVKDVVSKFDIGPNKVRVGTEIFSDRTYIQFGLNKHMTKSSLSQAISNIPYKRGTTNTGQALKDAYSKMFTAANGDRAGVPNIAIVVTDGRSTNRPSTLSEAKKLRQHNVQVFAVGVGNGVDKSELNEMATDPDATHVLTVQDFSQLQQITAQLNAKTCAAIPPSPQTLTPTELPPDPCQDTNPSCGSFEIPAVCSDYAAWARDNCERSCRFCSTSVPTTPPPCVDRIQDCASYDVSVCTGQYKGWARDNCRKYCGFCNVTSNQVLTGFFGSCYYQGKQYSQGQTWDDGCAYECTCDDASHGRYSCYNKCPVYYNLPPQCQLVKKNNSCCLEPVCDFKGTYGTTNGQTVGKKNGVNVCMYKGQAYYQGQTWQDGCDSNCYCQDGSIGLWTCSSVCATYGTLPPECHLEKPAGKCCQEPVCDFSKQFGQFTGAGSTSGKGSGVTPTTPGPCVDADANCARYQKDMCTNAQYAQFATDNCKKFCNLCNVTPTPSPNDRCVYKGIGYTQGQRWDDGCDLECVCENALYGFYRCNKKCADITNLPLGCTQVKKAGECCPTIQCSNGQTGTFQGSQTQPGTIGGYPVPQAKPTPAPTPGPGLTYAPGLRPTLGPNPTGNSLQGCLYKGSLYQTGMRWNDGCDFTCVCSDGKTGQYKCTPKCPTFPSLPKECRMQDNPNDPCCQQPVCTPGANGTLSTIPVPSYGKGFTGYGPPVTPQVGGTGGTGLPQTINPGIPQPTGVTGSGSGCVYKGNVYPQGRTWDDGCTYRCECTDGSSGQYRCTDRCPSYQNIPTQCSLRPDPKDSCCKVIQCGSLNAVTTPPPLFAQTTPPNGAAFCEYQGYYHRQGEVWNDGCGLTCRCEDATHKYYQCTDRCPKYENVPVTCQFVPDPKDSACCRVPQCQSTTGTGGTGIPQGFTGSFTGYGRPPNVDPATLAKTGYGSACLYKGKVHQQGETWQDGCDYECECTDASRGMYKCTERCQRIASLPTGCRFGQDPNDQCCQKVICDPTASQTSCKDNVNCASYGSYVCETTYKDWATQNCAKYCGICGGGSGPVTTPATSGPCKDAIPNCDQYGQSSCSGQYLPWARANCPVFCNLCNTGTGTGTGTGTSGTGTGGTGVQPGVVTVNPGPGTGTGGTGTGTGGTGGPCSDVLSNCQEYTQTACHEPYVDWARKNCAKFCGYCDQTGTGTGTGTGGTGTGGTGTGTGTGTITGGTGTGTGTGGTGTGTGTGTGGFGLVTQTPGSGFTGFSGGCVYKGQYYSQGKTWTDGCDYNCTCENGQTGFYRCRDRCPSYGQLPAGCVMRKPAGECCGVPDCSGLTGGTGTGTGTGTGGTGTGTGTGTGGTGTGTGSTGTGTGTGGSGSATGTGNTGTQTGAQPGCYYKNKLYQQGESWKDGCTYKCTCTNGNTHQYQCAGLCLNWQLPSSCHLDPPAAGKCCKTPNCPSNVVLNYPPGYVAE